MRCCAALLGLAVGVSCLARAGDFPAAPEFALKAIDGRNYRLSEYRGEVVAVVFWASWCGGCREQLALMRDLRTLYADWGLQVLAVNLDDRPRAAAGVSSTLGLGYPVLQDTDKAVSRTWDPPSLPATYLVDREGRLRYAQGAGDGPPETRKLIARLRALLDE
jgi:peroxiredoxin